MRKHASNSTVIQELFIVFFIRKIKELKLTEILIKKLNFATEVNTIGHAFNTKLIWKKGAEIQSLHKGINCKLYEILIHKFFRLNQTLKSI